MPRNTQELPMYLGYLPYPVPPEGLIMANLPQAFLTGIDIARTMRAEQEARQLRQLQVEQALAEQDLRLLNSLWNYLSSSGLAGSIADYLPEQQVEQLQQRYAKYGIDITKLKMPSVKDVYPNVSDILVGEGVANRVGVPTLGTLYDVVPGDWIVSAIGKEFGGKPISKEQMYLIPRGATKTYLETMKLSLKQRELQDKFNLKLTELQGKQDKDSMKRLELLIKWTKTLQDNYKPELIAQPGTRKAINEALIQIGQELGVDVSDLLLSEEDTAYTTKRSVLDSIVDWLKGLLPQQPQTPQPQQPTRQQQKQQGTPKGYGSE
jgi:hypothetical protein